MDRPSAVILKHNNPCGAAYGESLAQAFDRANRADRIAAFGGAVVMSRPCDIQTAELLAENYLEVVCAPEFEEGSLDIISRRKNLRVVKIGRIDKLADFESYRFVDFKSLIDGGIIVQQSAVNSIRSAADLKPATAVYKDKEYRCDREPTQRELDDMIFGWAVEHGGHFEFGALYQGRLYRRHRNRRAGPGRRCGNSGAQSLYQVRRYHLLRSLQDPLCRSRPCDRERRAAGLRKKRK